MDQLHFETLFRGAALEYTGGNLAVEAFRVYGGKHLAFCDIRVNYIADIKSVQGSIYPLKHDLGPAVNSASPNKILRVTLDGHMDEDEFIDVYVVGTRET